MNGWITAGELPVGHVSGRLAVAVHYSTEANQRRVPRWHFRSFF
ncbi:hypothetical protein MES5069_800024 [Mesorhizobium escarrei]|uniref:Uncharacterized protein n=1 Tax=Mesorhizobium escarrei TaxID=666018 RepID=A0ABM9EKB1_9HYPH|nr:hypothetical protein MES5069_800024 [Mesorhizobium escarrei]